MKHKMSSSINLVIVDDHALFRQGIRTLLDVILKTGTGFDLLARLDQEIIASMRVILLTMHSEPYLLEKISLFPCIYSYMLKDDVFDKLTDAIIAVSSGNRYMSDQLEQTKLHMPLLSGREEQVMLLTARGLHLSEIADQLFISVKTVEKHRANLFSKINVRNAVDLTRMAIRIGLIRP